MTAQPVLGRARFVISLSRGERSIRRMHDPTTSLHARNAGARAGKTVLVITEEPFVRELLTAHLRAAGCFPMAVATGEEGRRLAAQVVPDLIVFDADSMPAADRDWAVGLVRDTSAKAVHTAMLSSDVAHACGADASACGASLCVSKPFEPGELVHKLLRLLRPTRESEPRPRVRPAAKAPSIELDRSQPTVRLLRAGGWRSLDLPRTEHRLLAFLLSDAGRIRSRTEIRDAVWGDAPVDLRTVDQYVRRLRLSLEHADARGLVKTVTGVGYRIEPEVLTRQVN